ncbi:MAG: ABC transporter ATP-binding protein [Clostridia bacterium]|nr:ABC transporter ATP-binding protein [Clostridia bacterium]
MTKKKVIKKTFRPISYLKNYKWLVFLGPFFKALEALSEVFAPYFMALIIDVGIKNNDKPYIYKYALIILAINILGMVFAILGQKCASVTSESIGKDMRNDIFKHVNSFSHSELDKFSTTTILNRAVHDVYHIQEGTSQILRNVMRIPFLIVGSLVMALFVDLKLSLIFVVVSPILLSIVFIIMKKLQPLLNEGKTRLDRTSQITRENLSGVRVVRAFNKQNFEIDRFTNANTNLLQNELKQGYLAAILQPLIYLVVNIAIIAVIYFGGIQINIGNVSQGNLLAFINYFGQISAALVAFARIITVLTRMKISANRIDELMSTKNSITSPSKPITIDINSPEYGKVVFENVSFSYSNLKDVVINLNLEVNPGDTIGIIGGTGSGKSSIVNLIPRFYDATKGTVYINGHNVKKYNVEELRNHIGIVPQNPTLFSGTIRENLRWRKPDATDEEIIKALKIAQAYDFVKEYPDFLDHPVQRGGTNFSGGQKQRLTIARALVGNPSIIILDDSTSALDFATDTKLRKAINTTLTSTTFIVSQRTNSIKDADKIIVIDSGNILDIGKHEELLERCSLYKEIHESQNKKEGK